MKPVRVFLGAVPTMIDSIIRDVLSEARDIEVVTAREDGSLPEYDVLVLNELDAREDTSGYSSPRPGNGIVMVGNRGSQASVFRKVGDELRLDGALPLALEDAIKLAGGN